MFVEIFPIKGSRVMGAYILGLLWAYFCSMDCYIRLMSFWGQITHQEAGQRNYRRPGILFGFVLFFVIYNNLIEVCVSCGFLKII
jgi:hypothetical protein